MNTNKSVVTVSRKWNSPNILVWVNDEEIGMAMKLSDFLIALSQEIGNPALIMTKQQLLSKIQDAAVRVESGIKEQSATIV